MNMYGVMVPRVEKRQERPVERVRRVVMDRLRHYRHFLMIVVLPVTVTAGYLYLFASNQYVSEAHFLVRTASGQPAGGIGMSQALSSITGAASSQSEAISVADYLSSHDAVRTLRSNFDLVARFRRPGIDPLSKLWGANPSPERLLKFYNQHVSVKYNTETGITSLQVRAFRPDDAYQLVGRLLLLGEHRVNILNERSYADSIGMAKKQLSETEGALAAIQQRMTTYRQRRGDIDPQTSGGAQIGLVTQLTNTLSQARAQLATMGGIISRSSPQYVALAARVRSLEAQVAGQRARLTVGGNAIAADIGGFEDLKMRQDFLMKRYENAAAMLEKARDQALRQQLYVVRVVEPNMPVRSLYPERWRIVLTMFVALLVGYAIGWLIVAGMKEHAA